MLTLLQSQRAAGFLTPGLLLSDSEPPQGLSTGPALRSLLPVQLPERSTWPPGWDLLSSPSTLKELIVLVHGICCKNRDCVFQERWKKNTCTHRVVWRHEMDTAAPKQIPEIRASAATKAQSVLLLPGCRNNINTSLPAGEVR